MIDIEAQPGQPLDLGLLQTPEAGELARAAAIRAIAQRMLDNDAALLALIQSGGLGEPIQRNVSFAPLAFGEYGQTVEFMPPVGIILAVQGVGARLRAFRANSYPDDPARPLYAPPAPAAGCIFDVTLGTYGGRLDFDTPVLYGHRSPAMTFGASPWENYSGAQLDFTITVLPLANWQEDAQAT